MDQPGTPASTYNPEALATHPASLPASSATPDRPDRVVIALAAGRVAVGVLLLARPGLLPALLRVDRTSRTRTAWAMRMVGGREIGLGLGSVIAGRAEPSSARRPWVAAAMISDGTDAIAIAAAIAAGTLARGPATVVAASAAALAAVEVLLLTRSAGPAVARRSPG